MKFEIGEIAIIVIDGPQDVNEELRSVIFNLTECQIITSLTHDSNNIDVYVHGVTIDNYSKVVYVDIRNLRKRRPPATYKDQYTPCEKGWEELQKELKVTMV